MSADPETVAAIISHLDDRLERQDEKRGAEFANVYKKIDDHAERADRSLKEFARDTTNAFQVVAVQAARLETTLANHINTATAQFNALAAKSQAEDTRRDGWWKTGATILLGGGGMTAFLEWWRKGGN